MQQKCQTGLPRGSLLDPLKISKKKCSLEVCFGFVILRQNDNFWPRGVPGPFWGSPRPSGGRPQMNTFDYKKAAKVTKTYSNVHV